MTSKLSRIAMLLLVALALTLAACAKGPGGGGKPYTITMMNQSILAEPPKADDPVIAAIEKLTNTKLEIQWYPGGNVYTDKLNAVIAAGSLPMAVLVQTRPASLVTAMQSGYFWEVTPYLKSYPNIDQAQNKMVQKNLSLDGKTYSLFRSRSLVGDGIVYRKDWVDALGQKAPQTLDDVYAMIKGFTLNDPDKNGKADTIGFGEEQSVRGFNFILAATGGGQQWDVVDGKLVNTIFSKPWMDAMDFYRRMFSEKLMNQDMPLATRPKLIDDMDKGKIGVRMGDPDQITRQAQLYRLNAKAELSVTSTLTSAKGGVRILMDNGYTGEFVFPKSAIKKEADFKRVLAFFDKISEPVGANIFEWGLDGAHYSVKDGLAARTKEQTDKYSLEVIQLQQCIQIADGFRAMKGQLDPAIVKYREAKAAVADKIVPNPAASYISRTFNEKRADLNKIVVDARTKYIMGQIDKAGWQKALDDWKAAGGDQVTKELNELYAKDPNKVVIK
jgi:putative aldouronate transport system substrate-binding protein